MKRMLTYLTFFIALISLSLQASDLYLMKLSSHAEFEQAKEIVDFAYGTIDQRFIVELDYESYRQLEELKVDLQMIVSDFVPGNYYLIEKVHDQSEIPLAIASYFSSDDAHIAELGSSSCEILFREGYMTFRLGDRQTPIYFRDMADENIIILDSYPTDTLADLVSQDSLLSYVMRMQSFYTRFIGSDSAEPANNWLKAKFEEIGYTGVAFGGFSTGETWCGTYGGSNIICVKPGSENPDKVIVVGGHFDSIRYPHSCNDPNVFSPGADDNGSGTAAVLEIARIFYNMDNKKTIVFAGFGGEELGLYGSNQMAMDYYNNGTNIEVMVNSDMIGYTEDSIPDVTLAYNGTEKYKEIFARTTGDVAELIPAIIEGALSSDDGAFDDWGFNTVALHEHEFNTQGWHTGADQYIRLDFDYMEQVVQTLVASVAIIDQSPDPLVYDINDFGDGQSLRISWEDCFDCEYVLLKGPLPTFLDDTIPIPAGTDYFDLTNLTESELYYITVYRLEGGMPQMTFSLTEATTLTIPRAPTGLVVAPDLVAVTVSWTPNNELDIDYYKLFKKTGDDPWQLLVDNYESTGYLDDDVIGQTEYSYKLCAVDNNGFISDTSDVSSCFLASFDGGILFADETHSGGVNPTEGAQIGFYRSIMGTNQFDFHTINEAGDPLGHATMGRYGIMFWVDDDSTTHLWPNYIDSMKWYLDFGNDFLFSGWRSFSSVFGNTSFYPGDFPYDELGISTISENILKRFVGALGEGDWPDLVVREDAPNGGHMDFIQALIPNEQADVIYRFDSDPYHAGYQDRPVGIAYDSHNGKRVVLGFPIYWLTQESAEALIQRVLLYYEEESAPVFGDVNGDWQVNILDVTYMIVYIYQDGPAPLNINYGDPNNDCIINILDVVYLISYLYNSGPAPLAGCVE